MSRSYKKTPYAGQKKCKFSKKYSNKKIRKTEEQRVKIASGSSFKKVMNPWDICDFYSIETWKEFQNRLRSHYNKYHNGGCKYSWQYYCHHYGLDPNTLDWKKLRWVWYKEYKNK
jgi:hypothetical protein